MKKKYQFLFFPVLCAAIFLSSCQKSGGNEETKPDSTLSQKVDEQGLTDQQKKNALELKGKVYGALPIVGEEDPVYCNQPENITSWDASVPICYDPMYGILYYIDCNGSVIYAAKDGEVEVAVNFPGKRLFCRGGKLYFLLDSGTSLAVQGAKKGNILSYDPVTGDILVLSDEIFDSILVYQDLIFCRKEDAVSSDTIDVHYSFYFFETGELLAETPQSPISWRLEEGRYGEYFITGIYTQYDRSNPNSYVESLIQSGAASEEDIRIRTGMALCRWDGSGSIPLEGLDLPSDYYVRGEDIFWFAKDGIHTWNIPAQQEKINAIDLTGVFSCLLVGDRLYTGGGNFIDISNRTRQYCPYVLLDGRGSGIERFYTDGKRAYCIGTDYVGENIVQRLFYIEWCSVEEAYAFFAADSEALSAFEEILNYQPCEGIFRLIPMKEGVGRF